MLVFEWHCSVDQVRKLLGGLQRLLFTLRNNRLSDTPSETLLTIFAQHESNLVSACTLQEFRCGFATTGVHSHVQWPFAHKAKATFGVIELWG